MSDWREQSATDLQKEKLSFFGCEWDEGITQGQASDALDQCVSYFPDKETEWRSKPATREQLDELIALGVQPLSGLTFGEAKDEILARLTEAGEDIQPDHLGAVLNSEDLPASS